MIYQQMLNGLKVRISVFCMGLLLLMPSPGYGVEIIGLYQASLPVTSRNDEREEQQAFSSAMREVLVKVSGSNELLTKRAVRRALNNPESYVESFLYRTIGEEVSLTGEPLTDGFIELEISFFESEILRLLDDNNIPLWPTNRPATLLWLVVQEELGTREMLSSASASGDDELLSLIKGLSEERGVPLLFPLMDLEDRQVLGVDDLWELNEEILLQASQRYQAESILALRLYKSLSGELLGKGLYLFRDRVLSYSSYEDDLSTFVETAVSMTSEELSGYYGVLISGSTEAIVVNMKIDGIHTAKNYADLLTYLDELTDVSSFHIASVEQQSISLELSTGGQLRQLVEAIALERYLEPVAELQRNNDEVTMHYLWKEQR